MISEIEHEMDSIPVTGHPVEDFLVRVSTGLRTVMRMSNPPSKGRVKLQTTLEEWVLKHGRPFTLGERPPNIRLGEPNNCYGNASSVVLNNSHLVYCEGYASASCIPVLHAWAYDPNTQKAIEVTWRDNMLDGASYFGVPFLRTYLIKSLLKYEHYGLIDRWEDRWPVCRSRKSSFLWKEAISETKQTNQ